MSKKQQLLDKLEQQPVSHRENSAKEETVLEYCENFRRQFVQLFPNRRELILSPLNECGVRKFVCTTARASQIPIDEIYDLKSASQFVSDFFDYLPLDNPTQLPDLLPSPSTTARLRSGDCLDLSNVLCCMLRGVGFDAYCVSGYAPHWYHWAMIDSNTKINEVDYRMQHQNVANRDALWGRRVHCFVLVRKGKRRQMQDVFIEPSTGAIYPIARSPYLAVESIWNDSNYWVNMQTPIIGDLSSLQFDLRDTKSWEYVLMEDPNLRQDETRDLDDLSLDGKPSSSVAQSAAQLLDTKDVLDLPPAWCAQLQLPRDAVQQRFPTGQRHQLYRGCAITRLCPYFAGASGLVRRVELFEVTSVNGAANGDPYELHEYYMHRKDSLIERHVYPAEGRIHNHYAEGRSKGLKDWIEIDTVPEQRIFEFYPGSRIDGLIKREEIIGKKVMEHFIGRDNLLVYRSATVDEDNVASKVNKSVTIQLGGLDLPIRKIAEKYDRNPAIAAEDDIRKVTYFIVENKIRLDFHYGVDRVTASCRTYSKDNADATGWSVDELHKPPSRLELRLEFQGLVLREKDTITKIREHERTAHDLLLSVKREAAEVALEKNVYDVARDKAQEDDKETKGDADLDDTEALVDMLYPFLQQFGNTARLTYDQAKIAHDECLKACRDRLLERLSIIQARLDDENERLQKKQLAYQRQGHGEQEDEEMTKYYHNAVFKIQILKARIIRHDQMSVKKYGELEQTLRKDHRLRILYGDHGL